MDDEPDATERTLATSDRWSAVFWDIGGVILDLESVVEGQHAFLRTLIERRGLPLELEQAIERWREVVGGYFRSREGTEFRSARTAYQKGVRAIVGESLPEAEWLGLFEERTRETFRAHAGAVEMIRLIQRSDLHLGVISDIDTWEAHRILGTFDLRDRFDSLTTSEEVGRTKPDSRMFQTALGKAQVDPDRAIMIGDRYSHDMRGGREAGMYTVAYGADTGPAVDRSIEHLRELQEILEGDAE